MTNDLPLQFDPVLFAKQGRKVSGQIAAKELPRVAEAAANTDDGVIPRHDVVFGFVTSVSDGARYYRRQYVQTCQRCLQNAEVKIDQQFKLLLINPQSQELASKEGYELFEYEGQFISTLAFIEDEILLAMPIVVKHQDINECDPQARKWLQQKKPAEAAAQTQ